MKESNFVYGLKIWIRRPDKATRGPGDVRRPQECVCLYATRLSAGRLCDAILSPSATVGRANRMSGAKERLQSVTRILYPTTETVVRTDWSIPLISGLGRPVCPFTYSRGYYTRTDYNDTIARIAAGAVYIK